MLHQSHFFVKLFRVVRYFMHLHNVLLLCHGDCFALVVVESRQVSLVQQNFCRIIKEDTGCTIRQEVTQAILRGVVDPLFDPTLRRRVTLA